jgi:predicted enzyme related to lactoylglutathione lyase
VRQPHEHGRLSAARHDRFHCCLRRVAAAVCPCQPPGKGSTIKANVRVIDDRTEGLRKCRTPTSKRNRTLRQAPSRGCNNRIASPSPASVDYFEIGTPDPAAAEVFYGGLFGWTFGEASQPAQYSAINGTAGGLWNTSSMGGASWAVFYVHVDDVNAAFEHALSLGASAALPVIDNGAITFAHLVDPAGNRFAIWNENAAAPGGMSAAESA